MRIVSYNILDGGMGRADPLGEVIEAQRPDVVGLVEADDEAVVKRIAHRLGMDWIRAAGKVHALSILSRFPITQTTNYASLREELSRGLLVARVLAGKTEMEVALTHLLPYAAEVNEDRRLQEIQAIFPLLLPGREAGLAQVLMGDLNSNSPTQKIDPQQCKLSTRQAWEANGGKIPRRVIQTVLDQGFIDTLEVYNPTEAHLSGTFSTQLPGQRVDYIFLRGVERTRVRSAWIEQDRLAKYASDHFPVGAEIEL